MNSSRNSISFVLFKEHEIYGAIGNDILRRAMGVSIFVDTTIVLIKCTKEFVKHTYDYCNGFNIKIIDSLDINELEFYSNYIITHTWPKNLYSVSKIYGINNLILIEEMVPLIDRFKKEHIKQSFIDRMLTTKIISIIITVKYRKYIKKAKKYVAISDDQANILINRYSIHPDFISYDPIDKCFFKYSDNHQRDSLLVFNDLQNSPKFSEIIDICKNIGITRVVCIGGKKCDDSLQGIKIQYVKSYTFEEISGIYFSACLAITSEAKGSFELIPIESLVSGVPVITPEVPSINVLKHHFPYEENTPFFDYFEFMEGNIEKFISWYNNVNTSRYCFSRKLSEFFNVENVAIKFLSSLKSN